MAEMMPLLATAISPLDPGVTDALDLPARDAAASETSSTTIGLTRASSL
jgi:hypothetical protein